MTIAVLMSNTVAAAEEHFRHVQKRKR